jgi:hypothetical protein
MAEEVRPENENPYRVPEADLSSTDVHAPEGKLYTQPMIEHLRDTKPWVRFLAILGFIGIGFMIMASIGMIIAFFVGGLDTGNVSTLSMAGLGLFYLIFAAAYIAPVVFLHKYASSINELLLTGETKAMENALRHQKSFWKFVGIATIVGFILGVLIAIVAVVISVMAFAGR